MQKSAAAFLDFEVHCTDGYAGKVGDLYFDDWEWAIRYLVIEMSDSQGSIRSLISPLAVTMVDWEHRIVKIAVTIDKIRTSPESECDLPVSRQYEIALHRYFEWPLYWENTAFLDTPKVKGMEENITLDDLGRPVEGRDDLGDTEKTQVSDTSMNQIPGETDEEELIAMELGRSEESVEYNPLLRSFTELRGYRIQTTDSDAATVDDLIIDESAWNSSYLVVHLHNAKEGKRVLLTFHFIDSISWDTSRIFSSLKQEQLERAPAYDQSQELTSEYEKSVYDYYDSIY